MAGTPAFAAALLLVFGWFFHGLSIDSNYPVYNSAVAAFPWVLTVGGVMMAIIAVACFLGFRQGMLADGAATVLVGAGMFLVGAIQAVYEVRKPELGLDINSILSMIFGAMFVASGRRSLRLHRMFSAPAGFREARPMSDVEARLDAPEADPADSEARREAMQRLLRHKKNEPMSAAPAPMEDAGAAPPAPRVPPPRVVEPPPAAEAPDQATEPHEPEGGFLADLGREK